MRQPGCQRRRRTVRTRRAHAAHTRAWRRSTPRGARSGTSARKQGRAAGGRMRLNPLSCHSAFKAEARRTAAPRRRTRTPHAQPPRRPASENDQFYLQLCRWHTTPPLRACCLRARGGTWTRALRRAAGSSSC
jgi:hypothetical protein